MYVCLLDEEDELAAEEAELDEAAGGEPQTTRYTALYM